MFLERAILYLGIRCGLGVSLDAAAGFVVSGVAGAGCRCAGEGVAGGLPLLVGMLTFDIILLSPSVHCSLFCASGDGVP